MAQTCFTIATHGPGLYEVTDKLTTWLDAHSAGSGLLTLFCRHTSCALLIQENADPDVRRDLNEFFKRLVPPSDHPSHSWMTHIAEGPDDMPAHIKAALLPVSLSVPVIGGQLALGTWQGIFLFEHRSRPHNRQVVAHLSV